VRARRALVAVLAALVVAGFGACAGSDDRAAPTAPTSQARPEPSPAEVTSFSIETDLVDTSTPGGRLDDDRSTPKINVLLPTGYHDGSDRYPVLWLLHGADHGADAWLDNIETLAADLPAIVVMPDGGLIGMYTDWWNGGSREGTAWATFHLDTVRDEVEQRFRIREGRQWHAIAGVSMGGQGALRYAALLPDYFGSVATFSAAMPDMQSVVADVQVAGLGRGAVTYDDIFGPRDGSYAAENNPSALVPNLSHTRVFMTSGDGTNCPQDPVNPDSIGNDELIETVIDREQTAFAETARSAGVDITAVTTCGVHTFGVWERAFVAARDWGFFEPVAEVATEEPAGR